MPALERLGMNVEPLPRAVCSINQEQTQDTFGFKWHKTETFDNREQYAFTRRWCLEKYCGGDEGELRRLLERNKPQIILDAGCGASLSALSFFGDLLKEHDYLGVDISNSVEVAREKFRALGYPGDFLQCDLLQMPVPDNTVDMIFSEGVLHHTDDTAAAVAALGKKLKRGGLFLFYVYAKKAAIREFTDDYIRRQIQPLSNEQAWKALEPLTRLGIALARLRQTIRIEEDIPLLGIAAGEYDLQRFFYYNILKTFYREEFTLDAMTHVNFDWFRPLNCHRHTPDEVRTFCADAGLSIRRLHVEPAGITVVAEKP